MRHHWNSSHTGSIAALVKCGLFFLVATPLLTYFSSYAFVGKQSYNVCLPTFNQCFADFSICFPGYRSQLKGSICDSIFCEYIDDGLFVGLFLCASSADVTSRNYHQNSFSNLYCVTTYPVLTRHRTRL